MEALLSVFTETVNNAGHWNITRQVLLTKEGSTDTKLTEIYTVQDGNGSVQYSQHPVVTFENGKRVRKVYTKFSRSTGGPFNWVYGGSSKRSSSLTRLKLYDNGKLVTDVFGGSINEYYRLTDEKLYEIDATQIQTSTSRHPPIFRLAFDGGFYHSSGTIQFYVEELNKEPTITLNTTDNSTLYESDIFAIDGLVTDVNSGDVISVKYSIDGGTARAILANVSTGSAIAYAKNLTYKAGALYDGTTAVTGALAEGSQHTLRVWAEDDRGGKSPEIIRTFYVVPNRAASLTLDAFITRTGLINTDVVNISGTVADLDNGNVIVKYKIGNGAFVQVYNGPATGTPTPFNFNVLLADLAEGANQITIQAVDAYNAITQQVLSLTKTANEQPLLNAVTYYEITPPNGTTDGLQLYIERELGDLVVSVDVFMGASGETELFVPMTLASTANLTNGNVEDTFSYQHSTDATKVVIRINMSRASAATNKAIKKISGVLT